MGPYRVDLKGKEAFSLLFRMSWLNFSYKSFQAFLASDTALVGYSS